ncbi:MAG: hypothetical protein QW324_06210 [Thermofilaceae archaeon]
MKVYFWDLASSAAFTWLFFSDVDFIPARRPFSGIIIAKNPRRALNPSRELTYFTPTVQFLFTARKRAAPPHGVTRSSQPTQPPA